MILTLKNNLIKGDFFQYDDSITSNKALISNKLAKRLKFKLDDKMVMYFVEKPPRVIIFEIGGFMKQDLRNWMS